VTAQRDDIPHDGGSDGLWRWLVGGFAGGLILLGLLVAAYTIGYNSGQDEASTAEPGAVAPAPPASTPPTTTTAESTPPPETTTIEPTPSLVAAGEALYTDDGCAGCHSLNDAAGAGPSLNGAAGRTVELADGTSVTADDAYLVRSITDPDAEIVKGYAAGSMSAAIAGHDLADRPDDVEALVAFIKSQK
jgi:mono/diheme cytochrome c family protein